MKILTLEEDKKLNIIKVLYINSKGYTNVVIIEEKDLDKLFNEKMQFLFKGGKKWNKE